MTDRALLFKIQQGLGEILTTMQRSINRMATRGMKVEEIQIKAEAVAESSKLFLVVQRPFYHRWWDKVKNFCCCCFCKKIDLETLQIRMLPFRDAEFFARPVRF